MTDIALRTDSRELTAVEVKAHVQLVQSVLASVMKKGTHYGPIPGAGDKPVLFKPGAEVILVTFRIGVDPECEDLSGPDEIRYRVRARGIHQPTGLTIGVGVGECSSNEAKYRWRGVVCDEEFDETPEDRRREVWKRGRTPYKLKQVRAEPADIANTVLKMAKKRALIDLCLTATACSDIFAQDLEDLPAEMVESAAEREPPIEHPASRSGALAEPRAKPAVSGKTITDGQRKLLYAKCKDAGVEASELCAKFGAEELSEMLMDSVNEALAWLAEQKEANADVPY